jgi:hypothetical protein
MIGDSSNNAIAKKEKNRKAASVSICFLESSLFSLLLKYSSMTIPMLAIKIETSKINQYFAPNDIKKSLFKMRGKYTQLFFLMTINVYNYSRFLNPVEGVLFCSEN